VSGNVIFIEGGGSSEDLRGRCREGFRKLLGKCGLSLNIRLKARGGRGATFDAFRTAHGAKKPGEYVAMLIDSEDPVASIDKPWQHLEKRTHDNWTAPAAATDDQVLLMTTCMETWIVSDRAALREHYQDCLQESALPPVEKLESRDRGSVQDLLAHATRDCSNAYRKGKRSFEVLAKLDPATMEKHLPSFRRMRSILSRLK